MAKILLVEDDIGVARTVEQWLQTERHLVEFVKTGNEGLDRALCSKFDLIILDWGLPGVTGMEICRQFRRAGGKTPILMLTGKNDVEDKIAGLEAGADDYLTKPFHPRELTTRVKALLRRPLEFNESVVKAGNVELDANECALIRAGQSIRLMPREFELLSFLMRHKGQLFTAETLIDRVWSSETEVSRELVKVYITRLRKKIDVEGKPSLIGTVHGKGYRFDACES